MKGATPSDYIPDSAIFRCIQARMAGIQFSVLGTVPWIIPIQEIG